MSMQESRETLLKNMKQQTDFKRALNKALSGESFTTHKISDIPTDDIQVVNRKYVTLHGTIASRPNSSIATIGQRYFATDTNIPMTYNGTGWVNGVGSVVAST